MPKTEHAENTELLERPCSESQADEVRNVFGEVEAPTIYDWVLAGLAQKAHDGNASAAKELRTMIAEADKKKRAQSAAYVDMDDITPCWFE